MRRLVLTVLVATLLIACGGSTATPIPAATAAASVPATAGTTEAGAFAIAGLTANIVPGGPPDPSTFATSFDGKAGGAGIFRNGRRVAIYVVYQLASGLGGKVSTVTTSPDGNTIADSFDYPASAGSAYFSIAYQDGFALGERSSVVGNVLL